MSPPLGSRPVCLALLALALGSLRCERPAGRRPTAPDLPLALKPAMDAIRADLRAVRIAVERNNPRAGKRAAERLRHVNLSRRAPGVPGAFLEFEAETRRRGDEVARALEAGDLDAARAAIDRLVENRTACHRAYRPLGDDPALLR